MKKSKSARGLHHLSPTQFEHLVFDLLTLSGMTNVSWRTPGTDGGRDIEGYTSEIDLSSHRVQRRWFVECKRYRRSVDWPTVYQKLAYADSNGADVLLMCTTASFSPAAISEVDRWNSSRRHTTVRLWPGHELEVQLARFPDLRLKYGLASTPATPGRSVWSLALALAKTTSSHYSRLVFTNGNPGLMLQASQAFADLLQVRIEDVEKAAEIRPVLDGDFGDLELVSVSGGSINVDQPALRALSAYLAALSGEAVSISSKGDGVCAIRLSRRQVEIYSRFGETFAAIGVWGDLETVITRNQLVVRQR